VNVVCEVNVTDVPTDRRSWQIFWLLAVTQFMVILDTTIVAIALPRIQRGLGFTPSGLAWVLDAYMLVFGGLVLLGGRAADLFGRRRMLLAGMWLFVLGSVVCVAAPQPWLLVTGRAVQGLGGAMASPAALALVIQVLPEGSARNRGLSIWGGIAGVAGPTGVLLGGLLSLVAWQLVFVINIPIGLFVIAMGLRLLPASSPAPRVRMDVFGALAGTAGLCLLVYGAMRGAVEGWASTPTTVALAGAAVLLIAFVTRQLTSAAPLLPRSLFGVPGVVLGAAASGLLGMALYGSFITNTLDLQEARGYSAIVAALILVPLDICLYLGTMVAGRLIGKIGAATVLTGGLGVQAIALAWWALGLNTHTNVGLNIILPAGVASLGLGAAVVCVFVIGTSGVQGHLAGTASGLIVTANQVGGAIGIAALSTVAAQHTATLVNAAQTNREAIAAGHARALWLAAVIAAIGALIGLWIRKYQQQTSWHRPVESPLADTVPAD